MVAGVEFGHDWPGVAMKLQVPGSIFLRLIKVIIAPLLFSTLVVGIAGHGDLKKVGRMGVKALVYFEIVSTLALLIGFFAINISRAGEGVRLPQGTQTQTTSVVTHTASDLILNIFPENIAKSVAEGEVLQIVIFSILFALALAMVPEPKRRPLLHFCESLAETMFKFTNIVMLFAPIGVFGAIAYTVGHMGLGVLTPLLKLLATMYVALIVFVLAVLLPIALFIPPPEKKTPACNARPRHYRVCNSQLGSSTPHCHGEHGSDGRPARNRLIRSTHGIQLQSGRIEPLSIAGHHLHCSSRGYSPERGPASHDAAHSADQQ